MAFLDRYVNRGVMETNKGKGELGYSGLLVCLWLLINHRDDDVLTSVTSVTPR